MLKMTDPYLSSANDKLNSEAEIASSRRPLWRFISALWLQIVVIGFILVQLGHLRGPVKIFLMRAIENFVKQ